jgi:hypothetical protein
MNRKAASLSAAASVLSLTSVTDAVVVNNSSEMVVVIKEDGTPFPLGAGQTYAGSDHDGVTSQAIYESASSDWFKTREVYPGGPAYDVTIDASGAASSNVLNYAVGGGYKIGGYQIVEQIADFYNWGCDCGSC